VHGVNPVSPKAPFLDMLAEHGEVIAPSMPGFGGSPLPDDFETVYDLVHLWRDVLDALPDRVALIGFSFGGWIAAELAQRLPEADKPARVVLVGPSSEKHALPALPAGTVVVHGESDDVVPLSATLDWARPLGLPVIVLPGVGHFFHGRISLLKAVIAQQLLDLAGSS
jgi:alpha/beta superfamily hydrolase